MDTKLYNILLNEREKLPDFLYKINDYKKLSNIIRKIEKKNDKNIWYDLCLGLKGKVNNKYSAIYEIPTKQLLDSIVLIAQLYNIKQIDEIYAGLGLITNLLKKRFDEDDYKIKITASDNHFSNETSLSLDYTNIIKKDVSDIIWQCKNNVYPPDMIICAHPLGKDMYNEIFKLIESNNIKIIIIISNLRTNKILVSKKFNDYTVINPHIYQICYLDIFEINNIEKLYTRSVVNIFIRNDVNKINDKDLYNILQNNLYNYFEIDSKRIILQEYSLNNMVPLWVTQEKYKNNIDIIYNIFLVTKYIPQFITNLKLLIFWFIQKQLDIFPLNIKTNEDLNNYYKMFIHKINIPNFIPPYLINSYIWLYFSENNIENLDIENIMKKIIKIYFKNILY